MVTSDGEMALVAQASFIARVLSVALFLVRHSSHIVKLFYFELDLGLCPTGNPCMPRMRQMPVVPVCRALIPCHVGQITLTFSRIPAR